MRILWVATKAPVPPVDGGRLIALTTIAALMSAGHELTVVAPVAAGMEEPTARAAIDAGLGAVELVLVPTRPQPWPIAVALGWVRGLPVTIARHENAALRTRVDRALDSGGYDVVHAEQVQALAACAGAAARGVPIVLRAQNVESDVWRMRGGARPGRKGACASVGSLLARFEADRLGRGEGAAVRRTAATVALTARDAARLEALAGDGTRVRHIAAPFPIVGRAPGPALPGTPALTLPASRGWQPNDDAVAWFTRSVWPRIAGRVASAHLHVFGIAVPNGPDRAVTSHPFPADSAVVFPADAIVVVPLLRPTGVRMRILEAWARGLPVVATSAAVTGLDAAAARAVLIADTPDAMADAIANLGSDPALRARLVAAGTAMLRSHHDPMTIAAELAAVYRSVFRSVVRSVAAAPGTGASAARART